VPKVLRTVADGYRFAARSGELDDYCYGDHSGAISSRLRCPVICASALEQPVDLAPERIELRALRQSLMSPSRRYRGGSSLWIPD
jgi:hypothetical protein